MELKINLAVLTDEILEELLQATQSEIRKRNDSPLQERHWCNLTLEEQTALMKETAIPEVFDDWRKSQKLKRNRRYPNDQRKRKEQGRLEKEV
jgi:hypothetical protein